VQLSCFVCSDDLLLSAPGQISKHCSLFPGAGPIAALQDELKGFPTAKGTIQFPLDKPLPGALVKKLVKARIAENEGKKQS